MVGVWIVSFIVFLCLFVVIVVPALLPFTATLVFVPSVFCCRVAEPLFFFCQGNRALARRKGCRSRKQRVSTARTPFFFSRSNGAKTPGKKKEANGREHINQASTREEVVVKEKEKERAFPRVHHSFWCCSRREIAMVSVTVTGLYYFPVCAFFFFQFVWVSVSLRQRVSLPFPTSSRTCFCLCCFCFVL